MTINKQTDYYHNCRIYRPLELTDASMRFLGFITIFGRQAKAARSGVKVYDRNFEIMLAPSSMFNEPSQRNDAWQRISSAKILQEVTGHAPETCASSIKLQPDKAVWLANDGNDPSVTASGALALSFKDPNVTIDESGTFAKIIGELSGCDVRTKDSAGMLLFAGKVPKSIGLSVIELLNEKPEFMAEPFVFEPMSSVGPRARH